jgi:hypothetical protein
MKTYKDTNGNLWAYEEDGSQDDIIPVDFIQITGEEANTIRIAQTPKPVPVVPPTASELMAELQALTAKIQALGAK